MILVVLKFVSLKIWCHFLLHEITSSGFHFPITFCPKSCTDSINGEALVEQNSHSKPLSVEVDSHKEGKHKKFMKKTVCC